jgi:hypothetical protein
MDTVLHTHYPFANNRLATEIKKPRRIAVALFHGSPVSAYSATVSICATDDRSLSITYT